MSRVLQPGGTLFPGHTTQGVVVRGNRSPLVPRPAVLPGQRVLTQHDNDDDERRTTNERTTTTGCKTVKTFYSINYKTNSTNNTLVEMYGIW